MTVWPGDTVDGKWQVERLVAVQGAEGCTDLECTRDMRTGRCVGYHCPLCDKPTNSYGHHDCPRAGDHA